MADWFYRGRLSLCGCQRPVTGCTSPLQLARGAIYSGWQRIDPASGNPAESVRDFKLPLVLLRDSSFSDAGRCAFRYLPNCLRYCKHFCT
jgi:hypothetical protein